MLDAIICFFKGCDMQSRGGAHAGCCDDCDCSVPVSSCTRCNACDYGDTEEARQVVAECHRYNKPAGAMTDAELLAEAAKFQPSEDALPSDEVYWREEINKHITRRGLSMPVAA